MAKLFTDTKLKESMLQFISQFSVIADYSDTGYLRTPIGDNYIYDDNYRYISRGEDERDYVYTGVFDEIASTQFRFEKFGTISSRNIEQAVEPHIFTSKINKLINSKTCKWGQEDIEKFNAIDSCKYLMLPFNFRMRVKEGKSKPREIRLGTDSGYIVKIEAKYNGESKMCPLVYTCQTSSGQIKFNLGDYPSKYGAISFSEGNYVKTIIFNDRKEKQKVIVDCTGIYAIIKQSEQQISNVTNMPIDTTDWAGLGISKKIIQEVDKYKGLIYVFWRWIVPYGCGETKEMIC